MLHMLISNDEGKILADVKGDVLAYGGVVKDEEESVGGILAACNDFDLLRLTHVLDELKEQIFAKAPGVRLLYEMKASPVISKTIIESSLKR